MERVAKAPLKKLMRLWQGLGYYNRVRNIRKAAAVFVKEFGSQIPRDPDLLRKVPGFGPYTTGSVLSIAYDIRIPIIDANVRRVFMRILAIEGEATVQIDPQIMECLKRLLPRKNMSVFNQALMELGAMVCRSKEPLCLQCPVREDCKAFKKGIQEIIPSSKKKNYNNLDVVIGILRQKNRYYIQQRPVKGLLAEMWEFPGGRIELEESIVNALKRETNEECGVDVTGTRHFMDARHFYTNNRVKLHVYLCDANEMPREDKAHRWVTLKEIDRYPMPSGSVKIVERLKMVNS